MIAAAPSYRLGPGPVESSLLLAVRLAVGVLWLYTASLKLQSGGIVDGVFRPTGPMNFSQALTSFAILPAHTVPFIAFLIPWMEAVVGAALVLGLWTRAAGALSTAMLLSFTLAVASVIARGKNIECGCFGRYKLFCEGPVGLCKVGENMVLMAFSMIPMFKGGGVAELAKDYCPLCRVKVGSCTG